MKKVKVSLITITLITIIIISLLYLSSCDEGPTEPGIEPGRRDYTWSVDSIGSPGFPYLKSIWGSSPNNVWGAGFSEDVRDCLWHYNGISWKRAAEGTPITTSGIGSPIVGGVWGTAEDDVWAFGGRRFSNPERSEPFVMHFDGENWSEVKGDKNNISEGYIDIYSNNKDDFWISAAEEVYHYKMGIWKKYFIGEDYIMQSIEGIGNSVYITAYPVGVDTLFLMKFESVKFTIVEQTNLFGPGKFGNFGMLFTQNKVFTFDYDGAYEAAVSNDIINPNTWKTIFTKPAEGITNSLKLSDKNIWAVGGSNNVYHYNGSDWKEITIHSNNKSSGNLFWGIWGNGDEIFICDIENGKIYHGK